MSEENVVTLILLAINTFYIVVAVYCIKVSNIALKNIKRMKENRNKEKSDDN